MLIATDLHKGYEGVPVLDGVDLRVEPGKITALMGPSGMGKTTLLRCLSFTEPPDSGTISLRDKEYRFPLQNGSHLPAPWPELTVVFQQLFLWPHLTLRKNITLPMKLRGMEKNHTLLNELIETLGMTGFVDRFPNEASVGQRQRAAIARALVLEPKYILFDEITSALDVEQVAVILTLLQKLKAQGLGIGIVTHLTGFARRAADIIAFLDEGKIVESGGPELLESPTTERMKRFISVIRSAT